MVVWCIFGWDESKVFCTNWLWMLVDASAVQPLTQFTLSRPSRVPRSNLQRCLRARAQQLCQPRSGLLYGSVSLAISATKGSSRRGWAVGPLGRQEAHHHDYALPRRQRHHTCQVKCDGARHHGPCEHAAGLRSLREQRAGKKPLRERNAMVAKMRSMPYRKDCHSGDIYNKHCQILPLLPCWLVIHKKRRPG